MASPPDAVTYPPALTPGDQVRVIAPAGAVPVAVVWRALGWLSQRYRVRYQRDLFARHGYLAGDDDRRRQELQQALLERNTAAIVCARGGYGVTRIAHQIDWRPLREHPRWVVGFSDITAIHNEVAKMGVASLHGGNVTSVGRGDRRAREALITALEAPLAPRRYRLECLHAGQAHGRLFGGNLTLLQTSAAAGRLHIPTGAILFVEDIQEPPYRLDRALTSLLVGGYLREVSAVVLGQFSHCRPGRDDVTVRQIFSERLAPLGIPVAAGLPCGHELHNDPLVMLAPAVLRTHGDDAELVWGHRS